MNPQCERILRYLDEHGSITQMEATAELGIVRLPSRIHELRRDGYNIPKEFESGKNRFGETVHYARYRKKEPPALEADGSGAGEIRSPLS